MSESLAIERSKAVICRNLFNDPSELLRVDRFELVRTLGRGGMGVVYEAHDPRRSERVALKMLNGRGAGELYRLKREFRALAELAHPNLVALHELSVARQHAFFTMELVPGEDIVSFIRRGAPAGRPPPDAGRLRSALSQLCDGIRALHAAGKLHRDLKPSNVLVTQSGRVVLLDFGLVQDLQEQSAEIEGTPAYMAPEQRRGRASEASDWYAFGRILQQALRGRSALPLPCPAYDTGDALAQLAEQLLDAEPARRPGWAEVSAIVCGHSGIQPVRDTRRAPARPRDEDGFVGRAQELAVLEQAFAQSRRKPVLVVLRGESGIGKTTLMRRFLASGPKASAALVLSSRCYEHEFIPFKALDSAIDELSRHLNAVPQERLASLSGEDRRALLHLFPVLGRVPWLAPKAAGGEEVHPMVQRRRGFDALKKVLAALARERPLVLCIDDLQWSDGDSGVLLCALLCDADAPPLLVIASDRTDPGRLNPAVEELYRGSESAITPAAIEELTIGALAPGEAAALARTLLHGEGSADRGMSALIAAESRGNPLFLKELSRWAAAAPASFGSGTSIDAIVGNRMRSLSDASRAALELLAIAGRPLSTAVIAQALELPGDLHPLVLELRRARLVHLVRRAEAELLELDHDRIGEAVLRRFSAARRKELHAQLARALEAGDLHAEAALAQYIAAGLPEQAAQRARQAGYLALAALAFARAAWLFRQALELGHWPDATRAHLYGELGLALEQAGRGLDAAEAYRNAAALTEDPYASVRLEAQAAEHLTLNGQAETGFALLRQCYERLGMHWPQSRAGLVFSILKLLVVLQVRGPVRGPAGAAAQRLSRARLFPEVLASIEGYDMARTLHHGLLALREAEALGDPIWSERARGTRALLRCASVFRGGPERGLRELEACCAAAEKLGDLHALGELQLQLALAHQINGTPHAALAWANRCEATLRLLPLPPRALYRIMGLIVNSLHDIGQTREAQRRLSEFAHEARDHGDVTTSFWTHAHPLQLLKEFAADDRSGADVVLEKQARLSARHPSFQLLTFCHAMCRIENELYWAQPGAAREVVRKERAALGATSYPLFMAFARFACARVAVASAEQQPRGFRRTRWLYFAARDARALSGPKQGSTSAYAPLLCAGIASLRGRPDQASRLLEAASAKIDVVGCRVTAACARYVLGALSPDRSHGTALQLAAIDVLTEQGIVNPQRWVTWTLPGFRSVLERSPLSG